MNKKHTFIGIECKFSKLSEIWELFQFSGIDFGTHEFVTVDAAVYSKGPRIAIPSHFKPAYFQELIERCFVAEYLVLHLYPDATFHKNLDDYAQYLQSRCEMIVLIYDCFYVEIYCKNQVWLETLFQTAQKISSETVNKKYEDTDTRTEMYV